MNIPNLKYPYSRPRRNRSSEFIRQLLREHHLSRHDLIQPLFVIEGKSTKIPIDSMVGINRLTIDLLVEKCKQLSDDGISAVALFPAIEQDKKDHEGSEAINDNGLIQRAVRTLKREVPKLGLITDVALDPYTTHGHDGIVNESGDIVNDRTVSMLVQQALSHADSGADIVAPSDMMDGRIGEIRNSLEKNGFINTKILSYSCKYCSSFYGPFRDAIGSSTNLGATDKSSYQMDIGNGDEAIREASLDISEGADILMVKPGMPYLDIVYRLKNNFPVPIFVYQVSGEFKMLNCLAGKDKTYLTKLIIESLVAFKRAGATAIISYFSESIVKILPSSKLKA